MRSTDALRRHAVRAAVAATLLTLGAVPVWAQTSLPQLEFAPVSKYNGAAGQARVLLQSLMESSKVAGLSVAVAVDGDVVWAEGFGFADLENRVPVTPLTKFRIGSVSKPLTSTAMALLHDEGKLDFDAAIQKYVPYFPTKQWPVTVRQIAGHLGGIRTYDYANYDRYKNEFVNIVHYNSVKDALNIFKDSPLDHQPGPKYLYSSFGFNLLSAAVEGASGEEYLDYVNRHVLAPLKLRNTVADFADVIIPYRTRFYARQADGQLVNAAYADLSSKWGGGGWLSTPSDLAMWGAALIKPGFIKEATKREMWTAQKTTDGRETTYGMGFMVGKDAQGRRMVGHSGGSVGGTTIWEMYPDDGVVVAMTVNMSVSPMNAGTAETIAELFLDARQPAQLASTATRAEGVYTFTATGANGQKMSGTLELTATSKGYVGRIVPSIVPASRERRSQDGSYAPPQSADIAVAGVTVNGDAVHVVGADANGFVHMRFTLRGDSVSGTWSGRGVTGALAGARQRLAKAS
jgi:CubicO group peptidase (beta-lactamase class C family)